MGTDSSKDQVAKMATQNCYRGGYRGGKKYGKEFVMMKLLVAMPLIAGASWAGTTYLSGSQTESGYERVLAQLNRNSSLAFESKAYEAGFINSTAVTEVRSKDANPPGVLFTLDHTIFHSPVSVAPESARFGAVNIVTTLNSDAIANDKHRALIDSFDQSDPFVLSSIVSVDGTTKNELKTNSAEFNEIASQQNSTIKLGESLINFETAKNGSIFGSGDLPDFQVIDTERRGEQTDNTLTFRVGSPDGETLSLRTLGELVVEFNAGAGKIVDIATNETQFASENTAMVLDLNATQASPELNLALGIEKIESQAVALRSANLAATLTDFSLDNVLANHSFLKEFLSGSPEQKRSRRNQAADIIRQTFPPNTRLNIDAEAETVDGKLDSLLDLAFVGNGSKSGYASMITAADLIRAFTGSININADKAVLATTPLGAMVEHPLALLYLQVTDDTVSLNGTLEDLNLKVNGQSVPLELFGGRFLQKPLDLLWDF